MGLAVPAGVVPAGAGQRGQPPSTGVSLQLIRNGTCVLRYGGKTLLIDPFLSDAGALPAFNNTPNPRPNPTVPLPIPASRVVAGVDATLLTHTHVDHWDPVARDLLPKAGMLFSQPADRSRLEQAGFTGVRVVESETTWEGLTVSRVGAQHGRGEMAQRMGAVSGYVLRASSLPTVYIAGDTVWCPEVADAIRTHRPNVIVVNAGEAQFLEGGPIIMGVDDVLQVCRAASGATVVAVHMEAVNHCMLTRAGLRAGLTAAGITSRVLIPNDGEDMRI